MRRLPPSASRPASLDRGATSQSSSSPHPARSYSPIPSARNRRALKPVAVPVAAGVPAHIADVAARVQAVPGTATLVVGHSNTVPGVIEALSGVNVGPIAENEFNRLFIVRMPPGGPVTVEELTY